ncbi:hypothetical protein KP509_03G081900 [Ceratopteris richardii]|uniref:Uncharacterized protein n=1 Tax=Ceratopteris richardii TaxID=49495 RepID=A0A8T2V5J6_CERRI|nr:hypothetical protein KP509_03G081900 [Ceratopteris richardii]
MATASPSTMPPYHQPASVTIQSTAASQTPISADVQPASKSMNEDPWALVVTALMVTVMASHRPSAAASTVLLNVFRPLMEGWSSARAEARHWKEKTQSSLASHHQRTGELAHHNRNLKSELENLKVRLTEGGAKAQTLKMEHSAVRESIASLEKKLAEAEAALVACRESHAKEKRARQEEKEAIDKTIEETRTACEKLSKETDDELTGLHAHYQPKIKEYEASIHELQEKDKVSREAQEALKRQVEEMVGKELNLQQRSTELNTTRDTLQRQLQYQRSRTIRR